MVFDGPDGMSASLFVPIYSPSAHHKAKRPHPVSQSWPRKPNGPCPLPSFRDFLAVSKKTGILAQAFPGAVQYSFFFSRVLKHAIGLRPAVSGTRSSDFAASFRLPLATEFDLRDCFYRLKKIGPFPDGKA